jgi:hypothetical protein
LFGPWQAHGDHRYAGGVEIPQPGTVVEESDHTHLDSDLEETLGQEYDLLLGAAVVELPDYQTDPTELVVRVGGAVE